jgi:hypothetical protein
VKTPQERKKFSDTHLSSFTVKTLQERNSAQHPSLISLCVKTPQERKKFSDTHLSSFTVKTLQERNSAQHPSLISLCVKTLQERNSAIPISHLSLCENPSSKKLSSTHLSSL